MKIFKQSYTIGDDQTIHAWPIVNIDASDLPKDILDVLIRDKVILLPM